MPASPFQTRRRGRLIRLLCGDWFLFGRGGGRNLFGSGNDGGGADKGGIGLAWHRGAVRYEGGRGFVRCAVDDRKRRRCCRLWPVTAGKQDGRADSGKNDTDDTFHEKWPLHISLYYIN